MKLIWNKKVVRTMSLIMCCVLLLIGSVQIVWAMGLTKEEKVEMQDEIAMVEPYEMNVVLSLLGVQGWNRPPYSFDEVESMEQWGEQPDEPLGKYSAELLEEYIEGNIEVEIDYFYEYKSSGRRWLIQVIQIYIDGEQKYFKWYAWGPSAVEGVWSISGSGWTERVPKSVEHTGEDADEK